MKETTQSQANGLNHVAAIQKYIETISNSDISHALIVEGPAGWGKTTAVQFALHLAGIEEVHLGAYSTPLNLYNYMYTYSSRTILIDDCAGLFNDSAALSLLKSATWPSEKSKRIVKWGSTSGKVTVSEFQFTGKLIIVCNSFPSTPDGDAILSRGYSKQINVTVEQAKKLILNAAQDKKWFHNTEISIPVANFLIDRLTENTLSQMSFRTLMKGYELAEFHPDCWQELLAGILPVEITDPEMLVQELSKQRIKVKEQEVIFKEKTGLQRSSFFKFRKNLKYSSNYKAN